MFNVGLANLIVGLVIGILVGFGVFYFTSNRQNSAVHAVVHDMSMDSMMNQMSAALLGKTGDDFDKAFLEQMIIHHEGAVTMARAAKANSTHIEIQDLAQKIIDQQLHEIAHMQAWQNRWFEEETR
jgi:uncharacterized protein (DUF305 family)